MPYSKVSEARIKKLDGVSLTLEQVNAIARMADAIGGDYGWPTAIKNFKKSHHIDNGAWVKNADSEKEYVQEVIIKERSDGKYNIIGVSTAAIADKEDETFETMAIDYDAAMAAAHDDYPEFRMFHKPYTAIGKVTKMRRVGIFAVDEGVSYDDPFSLAVCKMLSEDTTGKWRMSRGFYVLEASGYCPECNEGLVIRTKHMVAGYKCPNCEAVHLGYKGVLKDVHFRKCRTFDDTITDIPCQSVTGVMAFKNDTNLEAIMNKKQLKQKLLDAGLAEDVIDERLTKVTDTQLKEWDDIPEAAVLKELGVEDEPVDEGQMFTLDPEVLKDFTDAVTTIVKKELVDALNTLEIEVEQPEMKESPQLDELMSEVQELKEAVASLLEKDEARMAQLLKEAPRAAKFRISRFKSASPKKTDEEDAADEEDMDDEEEPLPPKKGMKKEFRPELDGGVYDPNGTVYPSLTAALQDSVGGGEK